MIGKFYRLPDYARDGSRGVQLIHYTEHGTVLYGWLLPATDGSDRYWVTLDRSPWVYAGMGCDAVDVARINGYTQIGR